MKWQSKVIAAIAAALLFFTLLACDGGPNPTGDCIAPSPCGAAQGVNP